MLEETRKEKLPIDVKVITLGVSCYNLNDEDVDIPLVRYAF